MRLIISVVFIVAVNRSNSAIMLLLLASYNTCYEMWIRIEASILMIYNLCITFLVLATLQVIDH